MTEKRWRQTKIERQRTEKDRQRQTNRVFPQEREEQKETEKEGKEKGAKENMVENVSKS